MNVLLLLLALIDMAVLPSSSQESPRRAKTQSSQAHPVVQGNQSEAQQFNVTETLDMERNKIETLCMIGLVIVLFLIFVGIAAGLEFKNHKSFKLADNHTREGVELVSMRAIENDIEETSV
ncbi:unnamed protein product [Caenorhabditis nigoni]|uniref:Uncharacterized protein n=1 Tax=Caenorhabditis nigoni TaxID=1611254 RepID=A0A2G5SYF0_9PELO|nr:hypothetical protein B9Z55_025300 [Caenorhabditis nigoni]